MPTPRQKLVALHGRAQQVWQGTRELLEWTRRLLGYIDDADLNVTGQQTDALLADYPSLRDSVLELAQHLPPDLAAFEPDPSEYEEAAP